MASLYQRFAGKINTNSSFPDPPEASHLLGQSVEGERAAESQRPRLRRAYGRRCEDEDVRPFSPLLVRLKRSELSLRAPSHPSRDLRRVY